jgi:hypothetical protein
MNSISTQPYIPILNETTATNESKTQEFIRTFFPEPPPATVGDIGNIEHATSAIHCDMKITKRQLRRAIQKLSPNKAPGSDGIINKVMKENIDVLEGHLLSRYRDQIR